MAKGDVHIELRCEIDRGNLAALWREESVGSLLPLGIGAWAYAVVDARPDLSALDWQRVASSVCPRPIASDFAWELIFIADRIFPKPAKQSTIDRPGKRTGNSGMCSPFKEDLQPRRWETGLEPYQNQFLNRSLGKPFERADRAPAGGDGSFEIGDAIYRHADGSLTRERPSRGDGIGGTVSITCGCSRELPAGRPAPAADSIEALLKKHPQTAYRSQFARDIAAMRSSAIQ
jgi:hypothetical protein